MNKYSIPFLITFFAGMTTVIGGLFSFFIKRDNSKVLSLGLGFSAGALIYVSFMELLRDSERVLYSAFSEYVGSIILLICFFSGMIITALIDYFMPSYCGIESFEKDNQPHSHKDMSKLYKAGIFLLIAISVHKLPEGFAIFLGAQNHIETALALAFAVSIHNIPEGVSIALPVYYATGSKLKAVGATFISGLVEPIGALLGLLLLGQFFNDITYAIMFAFTAGIMIYVSFDSLLPMSREYGDGHFSIFGVGTGMFLMMALESLHVLFE